MGAGAGIVVIKPGPLMTVQDLGRPGLGRFGISPSGAMDPLAARAANALAGNPPGAALLEITGPGGELLFEEARLVAAGGADLAAAVGGVELPVFGSVVLRAGDRLRFHARRRGARAYLAVAGGLEARRSFGSAASDLASGLGGRPLRAGDRLALGPVSGPAPGPSGASALARWYDEPERLRFVPAAAAPAAALARLAAGPYVVSPRSSRTGYLLDGPAIALPAPDADGDVSEPMAPGAIQVPPDGRPILLMADRQTVGGYPVIGFLAAADAPKAAQLWPADRIHFSAVSLEQAQRALREQAEELRRCFPGGLP